jgi:hypothetical protein
MTFVTSPRAISRGRLGAFFCGVSDYTFVEVVVTAEAYDVET